MRVYLPATVADLSAPAITSRQAHAATASLAAALPDEDEEGLEVGGWPCAARPPHPGKCSRNSFKLLRINGLARRPFLYTFVPVKRERACFQSVVRKAIIRQSKDCYRSATLANCSRQKGIDIQRDRGDWFISPSFRLRYSEKVIQRSFRKNVSAIT